MSDVIWRKSSRSGSGAGNNCVEVGWRNATRSGHGAGTACVEVAQTDRVLVRDSKDPEGGRLAVSAGSWTAFLATLR